MPLQTPRNYITVINHDGTMESDKLDPQGRKPFLKALRARLGDISQEELARRIGVSLNSVSRWERGITPATFTVPQLKAFVNIVRQAGLDVQNIPDDFSLPIISDEIRN